MPATLCFVLEPIDSINIKRYKIIINPIKRNVSLLMVFLLKLNQFMVKLKTAFIIKHSVQVPTYLTPYIYIEFRLIGSFSLRLDELPEK